MEHDGDLTPGMNSYYGTDITMPEPIEQKTKWGAHGTRWDEECRCCGNVTQIDNDTELCEKCGSK